jgi:sulfatase maturation enzyme AslB (radical SAM superfamily)
MKFDDIKNTQFFTVLLTGRCDYRCAYCDEEKYALKKELSFENYKQVLRFIDEKVTKPISNIHLFGGEPTLNKEIFKMVEETKKRENIYLNMTTNLNKTAEYYLDLGVLIVASYHHQYLKENPESWFEKALRVHEKGLLKHITMMLYPEVAEQVYKFYHQYLGKLPMIVVPLFEHINSDWFKAQKSRYETDPFSYEDEANHFIGEYDPKKMVFCSSGLIVDEQGYLHYCWPRYFEKLSHVSEAVYSHCHICTKRTSACDSEIVMSHNIEDLKFDMNHKKWRQHWIFCNA